MTIRILPKRSVASWIDGMRATRRVVAPRGSNGRVAFGEIEFAAEIALDYKTTILPPKKALLPTHEVLFRFKDGEAEGELQATPIAQHPQSPSAALSLSRPPRAGAGSAEGTVLFGVHTCDLHAIGLLDRVFGNGLPDQAYQRRRAATVMVGLECLAPCSEHAFCKSMGTLSPPEGVDLHLIDLGDSYAMEIGTEAGAALVQDVADDRPATDEDLRRLDRVMSEKWARFPLRLEFDVAELPSLMTTGRESPLWAELAERCLGCGSCTIVCPTCSCFDVRDQMDLSLRSGARQRVWDSCQLASFAVVAGGHNFRGKREARLRHRFLRKGKYQLEAFGVTGCVGCGRCAQACLAKITPIETYNGLHRRLTPSERPQAEVAA